MTVVGLAAPLSHHRLTALDGDHKSGARVTEITEFRLRKRQSAWQSYTASHPHFFAFFAPFSLLNAIAACTSAVSAASSISSPS